MLQMLIELVAHLIQRTPKNRKHLIQLPPHTHTLRTLTSKQKRQSTNTTHRNSTLNHIKRRLTPRKQRKTTQQHLPINTQHHRTMLKHRTTNQRQPNIQQLQPSYAITKLPQPLGLSTQGVLILTRKQKRKHTSRGQTAGRKRITSEESHANTYIILNNNAITIGQGEINGRTDPVRGRLISDCRSLLENHMCISATNP